MQGLTNYDVIEAYTEDFTTWVYNQNAGVANITSEKNASTHLFRDGHRELTSGEYLLPFETLYLRVDVPEGYTMQDYVFDGVE